MEIGNQETSPFTPLRPAGTSILVQYSGKLIFRKRAAQFESVSHVLCENKNLRKFILHAHVEVSKTRLSKCEAGAQLRWRSIVTLRNKFPRFRVRMDLCPRLSRLLPSRRGRRYCPFPFGMVTLRLKWSSKHLCRHGSPLSWPRM